MKNPNVPASRLLLLAVTCFLLCTCGPAPANDAPAEAETRNNPIFEGWYADPEAIVFGDEYWIYPTYSDDFEKQVFMDAFSSPDLVHWTKHERILDTTIIKWARQAMWAPSVIENNGKYFLFFGANDVQRPSRAGWDPDNDINHFGGIGVAVADKPGGPFTDHLGEPLIDTFYNDAQPIDQFAYRDDDGTVYFFYGGWSHCNLGRLNADFTGFEPWEDGEIFREITPEGYVEGPFMFKRKGTYYFMWSEGGWTNGSYRVAYATAPKVTGPYTRQGIILSSDSTSIATGAGHHSVLNKPGTDEWIMVYHRRPIPNEDRDHRVVALDRMEFDGAGKILPVVMTWEGIR